MGILKNILLLLGIAFLTINIRRRRRRLPPGPKGWPLVGNFWSMPKDFEWLTYQKWSREFGMILLVSSAQSLV